jgi:hypothetical protein
MMLEAIFIYPDFGYAKVNKDRENEAKKDNQRHNLDKKGSKITFWI